MRSTTLLSLLLAALIAGVAVFGARTWLDEERQRLFSEVRQSNATEPEERRTIVIADQALRFGQRVTREKLREIEWASDVTPRGSFETIDDVVIGSAEEDARFVVSSMEPGEPLLASKITEPGQRAKLSTSVSPGLKAVSIRVNDVQGVAGFVLPGDRVDVMLTRASRREGEKSYVDVLLQGVKVLAIDQIADDRKDQPSVVRTVTFEVNTEEAQKLALGASIGTLSLALRNIASSEVEEIKRITLDDLGEVDVAEDLIPEPEPAPEEPQTDEELERLTALEELLKGFTAGISERMDSVEASIQNQEPVIIEKEVVKEVEVPVEVPAKVTPPAPPVEKTVGVIRNGRRDEYRVMSEPETQQ
ncbi:MAG: Flp pilus assembly protein CpaB [Paracoccaceae bacterium]